VIAVPLDPRSVAALSAALRAGGVASRDLDAARAGLAPAAIRLLGLEAPALEALVRHGGRLGLDVVTGTDWAIVAGSRARLSSLARPWVVPADLAEVAAVVGTALPPDPPAAWRTAIGPIPLDRPTIVGILNLTPDSFSDGGALDSVAAVLRRAEALVQAGAAMLDLGGESTRPGRTAVVPADEEARRVVPAVECLARELPGVPLSIDTVKSGVARAALDAGAAVVNDVSGLRLDPAMAAVVASAGAGVVLMHSRGEHLELASYAHAEYADGVLSGVLEGLRRSLAEASAAGIAAETIAVDPGLGFGKTPAQSVALLDGLGGFLALGRPVYLGPSRKRFLGEVTGLPTAERDGVTAVACALAWERGARIFRVHDVARAREALALASALDSPSDRP
jgi:dihydropteroate synthase